MIETAKKYVEYVREPEHTKVIYRYKGIAYEDIIEGFINEYGHMEIDINGGFYNSNGYLMTDSFIERTL
jgi:hypothetical protein